MEFGDILRQIRAERGLSQDELAALLGTTKQVISRYETKKRVPRLSVVTAFAQKLGLPVSALSGEEAIMPPELMPVSGMRRVPILGSAACGEPIYKPGDGTEFVTVEDDFPWRFRAHRRRRFYDRRPYPFGRYRVHPQSGSCTGRRNRRRRAG